MIKLTELSTKDVTYTAILLHGPRKEAAQVLKNAASLKSELPCGNSYKFRDEDVSSGVDIPCPCGHPKHWFLRFTE